MILPFLLRRLVRPYSRPAALFLLWSHRRTIALWARSIRAEFERGRQHGYGLRRALALLSGLRAVSARTDLMQENSVQSLTVADDDQSVVVTLAPDDLVVSSDSPRNGVDSVSSVI